jgi:hypothetical protein
MDIRSGVSGSLSGLMGKEGQVLFGGDIRSEGCGEMEWVVVQVEAVWREVNKVVLFITLSLAQTNCGLLLKEMEKDTLTVKERNTGTERPLSATSNAASSQTFVCCSLTPRDHPQKNVKCTMC